MPFKDKTYSTAYQREYGKQYYKLNKKHIDKKNKRWQKNNREKATEFVAKSYQKHKIKRRKERHVYYSKNKQKELEYSMKYRKSNPDVGRKSRYKIRYGLTLEGYNKMLKKQKNKCAICKITDSLGFIRFKKRLEVDHCHKSNKVRGLLCDGCNNGLGRFNDNPRLLIKAAKYLRKTL